VTRAWLVRPALAGLLATGMAACGTVLGLGGYGNAPDDAGADSLQRGGGDVESVEEAGEDVTVGGGADATMDATEGAPADAASEASVPAEAAGADGGFVVPSGWTLVAFASTSQSACPAGFTNPTAVVFGTATAGTGACTCNACSITTQPSCVTGEITDTYNVTGGACSNTGAPLANTNAGGCNAENFGTLPLAEVVDWVPPGPSGGACSISPTADTTQVSFAQQGLVCSLDEDAGAGCDDGGACSPAIRGPFKACILPLAEPDGGAICPPGFGVAVEVGTGATLGCSDTCDCAVQTTCEDVTLTYYSDNNCQRNALVSTSAGICARTGASGSRGYQSYILSATVNATCAPSGTSTVTSPGLANEQTVCCVQ